MFELFLYIYTYIIIIDIVCKKKKWKKKENKEREKINDWIRKYSSCSNGCILFSANFVGDKRTTIKNKYIAILLTTLLCVGSNIVIKPVVIHTMRVYMCVCKK